MTLRFPRFAAAVLALVLVFESGCDGVAIAPRGVLQFQSYMVVFDDDAIYDTNVNDMADIALEIEYYPALDAHQRYVSLTSVVENANSPVVVTFLQEADDWHVDTQAEDDYNNWPPLQPTASSFQKKGLRTFFDRNITVRAGEYESLGDDDGVTSAYFYSVIEGVISGKLCDFDGDDGLFHCAIIGTKSFPYADNNPWQMAIAFSLECTEDRDCGSEDGMTNSGSCSSDGKCSCIEGFTSRSGEDHGFDCAPVCDVYGGGICTGEESFCDEEHSTSADNIVCQCPQGKYLDESMNCKDCPIGMKCFGPRGVAQPCGEGEYFRADEEQCVQIPLGEKGQVEVIQGLYLENIGTEEMPFYRGSATNISVSLVLGIEPCAPGHMCVDGTATSCVDGSTYQPQEGQSSCLNCDSNCRSGFMKTFSCNTTTNTVCEDIDECLERCLEKSEGVDRCENKEGGFACHCKNGYAPAIYDPSICVQQAMTSSTSNSMPTSTMTAATTELADFSPLPSSSNNNGAIIGGVMSVLVVIVVVVVLVRRNRAVSSEANHKRQQQLVKSLDAIRGDISFGNKLGGGQFGDVIKARIAIDGRTYDCAVKILRPGASEAQENEFKREAMIMSTIGNHHNIVTLLGVCFGSSPLLIVLELVTYGNLRKHLRSQRTSTEPVTANGLLEIVTQIANGMAFIASKGVVHGDLAARNVLYGENDTVKITDFGLSQIGEFCAPPNTKLPIKWMAPETIQTMQFTFKSDVWSFGVLFWEVFTLGGSPYYSVRAKDVLPLLTNAKKRLECPHRCPVDLYNAVPRSCFAASANARPSFSELVKVLRQMQESGIGNKVDPVYYSEVDENIESIDNSDVYVQCMQPSSTHLMINPTYDSASTTDSTALPERDYVEPLSLSSGYVEGKFERDRGDDYDTTNSTLSMA
eukprot:m.83800 g.83800  ORF g.83800 m.83800 type:complete len:919 (-) comp12133_c0_seq1:33-2789(-)